MLVKDFTITCAACHAGQIVGEGKDPPAIPFLRIPGLDLETLQQRGLFVGDWPTNDETLTSFMELLLSSEPTNRMMLSTLANVSLLDDLNKANTNVLAATEQLAWSIKELLFEFDLNGQKTLQERLNKSLGQDISDAQLRHLGAQLPREVFAAAQSEWFPNLPAELRSYRSGQRAERTRPETKRPTDQQSAGTEEFNTGGGGWRFSRSHYAILYRPAGHADAFIRAWLDLATAQEPNKTPMQAVFKTLAANTAPGRCVKCHSIDEIGDSRLRVNWSPAKPLPDEHHFTKFSHVAHFSLLGQKECLTCHDLKSQAPYQNFFETNSLPAFFSSNFNPVQKSVCTSCHTAQKAREDCLLCHNYHVGTFSPALRKKGSKTSMK